MHLVKVNKNFFEKCINNGADPNNQLLHNESGRPCVLILKLEYKGKKRDFVVPMKSNIIPYTDRKTFFALPPNSKTISIPAIIALLSLFISLSTNKLLNAIFVSICFFLTICFIFSVIVFSNQDENMNKEYEKLLNDKMELTNILAHMENSYKTSIFTISAFSSMMNYLAHFL